MELEDALMAKLKVEGLDVFRKELTTLANDAHKINRGALGSGAGYVADKIKDALEGLPTHDDDEWGSAKHKLFGATEDEKRQIIDNFGIAKFRESGGKIDTAIGFYGYVETKSSKYNDHVPTGMLMQCINYGTDFRQGTHTVDQAIKAIKDEVAAKMQEQLDESVKKIMK